MVVERYAQGTTPETKWYSFSIAKSVVSLLMGAALRDGYIQSLDAPVTDYLPILAGSAYEGVTIRHVLQMASGAGAGGRRARRLLSQRHAPRLWTHRPVRNATRHAPRRHVGPPQRLDGRVHKSLGKRAPPVSHSSHRGYSITQQQDVTESV